MGAKLFVLRKKIKFGAEKISLNTSNKSIDTYITNPDTLLTEITQLTKNHPKERMRRVYLGTKKVEGSKGLAIHWAIGLGNGVKLIWMEVDGNAGGLIKKSIDCKNTINGHHESS